MKTPESRRNMYAYALLGSITIMTLVGLISLWSNSLQLSLVIKILLSCGVIAGLSGFLFTLTYNHDRKLIQKLGTVIGIAAVAFSLIILGEIWFAIFKSAFAIKMLASIVIIGLLAGFGIAMADDFFESKKMKDENYLD